MRFELSKRAETPRSKREENRLSMRAEMRHKVKVHSKLTVMSNRKVTSRPMELLLLLLEQIANKPKANYTRSSTTMAMSMRLVRNLNEGIINQNTNKLNLFILPGAAAVKAIRQTNAIYSSDKRLLRTILEVFFSKTHNFHHLEEFLLDLKSFEWREIHE